MSKKTEALIKAKQAKEIKESLMLSKSPLNAKQLLQILQKTPKEHIFKRPGKGEGEWEYVTGIYVKKVLNYVFGWLWDFEVVEHGRENAGKKGEDQVWVLGKLTVKDKKGLTITKTQFGRADVKYRKNTNKVLDFGNDLKAAATDSLKKCASELGIASDVYGKEEFKEIQTIDKGFTPPENGNKEKKEIKKVKVAELKEMLKGETDKEKIANLKKRTGITLQNFQITEKHAGILVASLLNSEVKK